MKTRGGGIRTIQQRQNNKVPVGIPRPIKEPNLQIVYKKKKRRNRVWGEEEEFYSESIEIFFRRIKKFPRVRKRMLLHIQEAFKTSIKQDQKRISLRIIIKTQNTQNKAGILKVAEASPSQRHQVILLML